MCDKDILEDLSQGKTDQIETRVQNFLKPILNSVIEHDVPNPSELNTSGLFCVKFFHTCISILESRVNVGIVQAIVLCCHGYTKCKDHVKLKTPLTVHKLMYHIISKLSTQVDAFFTDFIEIAEFLYEELRLLEEDERKLALVIIMNSYTALWNTSFQMEQNVQFTSFHITALVRFMAIKLLTLNPESNASLGGKIEVAFSQFNLRSKRKNKIGLTPTFFSVFERFCEMLQILVKIGQGSRIFKPVMCAVKQSLKLGVTDRFEILLEIMKSVKTIPESDASFPVTDAICNLVKALILLVKFMKNETVDIDVLTQYLVSVNDLASETEMKCLFVKETIAEGYLSLLEVLNDVGLSGALSQLSSVISVLLKTLDACHNFFQDFSKLVIDAKDCSCIRKAMLETFHLKFQLQYWIISNIESDESLQKVVVGLCGVKKAGSIKLAVADWTVSTVNTYLHQLETTQLENKLIMDEKYYCGYMVAKLGQRCSSNSLHNAALHFYNTACSQWLQWCYDNPQIVSKRLQESSIWKIYCGLADSQMKHGLWHDAMETIVTGLLIDRVNVSSLMRVWFIVKKDAVKDGLDDIMNITVKDLLLKRQEDLDEKYIVICLQAELEIFHSKKKYPQSEAAILNALVTSTSDPQVKAVNLMKLSEILWLNEIPSEKSAEECVSEVFDLLEKTSTVQAYLILGQANLWKFIMAYEDMCKQVVSSKSAVESDLTDGDNDTVDTDISSGKLYSLRTAEEDFRSLTTALELWEKAISQSTDITEDAEFYLNSMLTCAGMLRFSRKPVEEIRVLTLALKVSSSLQSQASYFKVIEKLCTVLLEEGFFDLAIQLIPTETDGFPNEQNATFALLKAQYQLCVREITASFFTVENSPLCDDNKGWNAFLLDGKRKRLLSQILCHPNHTRPQSELSPLVLAHDAVRQHTGVVHFLLGKDFIKGNNSRKDLQLVHKWTILDEFFKSLLHLAQLYRHVGQEREARCYLTDGIKVSKAMCIPRWYANFLLEMCRVQSLADRIDEAGDILDEVASILDPQTEYRQSVKPVSNITSGNLVIHNIQENIKIGRLASFGDSTCENIRNVGDIESMEDRTLMCSTSTCAWPDPAIRVHESGCHCCLCGDRVAQRLSLKHTLALGELFFFNDTLKLGDSHLRSVESKVKILVSMDESLGQIVQDELCKVVNGCLNSHNLPVCMSKADCGLTQNGNCEVNGHLNSHNSTVCMSKADCVLTQNDNCEVNTLQVESYCLLAELGINNVEPDIVKVYTNKARCLLQQNVCMSSFHEAHIEFLSVEADMQRVARVTQCTQDHSEHGCVAELTDKMIRCNLFEDSHIKTELDDVMEVNETDVRNIVEDNLQTISLEIKTSSLPESNDGSLNKTMSGKVENLGLNKDKSETQKNPCLNKDKLGKQENRGLNKEILEKLEEKAEVKNTRRGRSKQDIDNVVDASVVTKTSRSRNVSKVPVSENEVLTATRSRKNLKKQPNDIATCPTGHFSPYKPITRKNVRNKKAASKVGDSLFVITDVKDRSREITGDSGFVKTAVKDRSREITGHSGFVKTAVKDRSREITGDSGFVKTAVKDRSREITGDSGFVKTAVKDRSRKITGESEQRDVNDTQVFRESKQHINVECQNSLTGLHDSDDDFKLGKPKRKGRLTKKRQTKEKKPVNHRENVIETDDVSEVSENVEEDVLKLKNEASHSVSSSRLRGKRATKTEDLVLGVNQSKTSRKVLDCRTVKTASSQDLKPASVLCTFSNSLKVSSKRDKLNVCTTKPNKTSTILPTKQEKKTTCTVKQEKTTICPLKQDKVRGKKNIQVLKERNAELQEDRKSLSVGVESAMIYDFIETDSPVAAVKSAKQNKKTTTLSSKQDKKTTCPSKQDKKTYLSKQDKKATCPLKQDKNTTHPSKQDKETTVHSEKLDKKSYKRPLKLDKVRGKKNIQVLKERNADLQEERNSVGVESAMIYDFIETDSPVAAVTGESPGEREIFRSDRQVKATGKENTRVKKRLNCLRNKTETVNQSKEEMECGKNTEVNPSEHLDHDLLTSNLEEAFNKERHFPRTKTYVPICRLLAMQYLNTDPYKTAFYLMEASAVTLRHQAFVNIDKKKRKLMKETALLSDGLRCDVEQQVNAVRKELMFDKDVQHFKHMVNSLPPEWTVCQLSVVNIPTSQSRLFLTRLRANKKPITVELKDFMTEQGEDVIYRFAHIMTSSPDTMKITDRALWWKVRQDLDNKLQNLLKNMEKVWVGCWKCLLRGSLRSEDDKIKLRTAAENLSRTAAQQFDTHIDVNTAEMLIEANQTLSVTELVPVVSTLLQLSADTTNLSELVSLVATVKIDSLESAARHPVLLVLDKKVQQLPWESIPMLLNHPITRIPSLIHLHAQLQHVHINNSDVFVKGVNPSDTFFVLNPDKNLPTTQNTFEDMFTKEFNWSGVVGEKPSAEQLSSALTSKDLFVYCGHGSGNTYFPGDELQLLSCRAAVLLMGCSSGELKVKGRLEPAGMILNYFLSGCPCIVANLWDVTDRDIDRFLNKLLQLWTTSKPGTYLLDVIPQARISCRLPSLIGAAPVVYGLPIFLEK